MCLPLGWSIQADELGEGDDWVWASSWRVDSEGRISVGETIPWSLWQYSGQLLLCCLWQLTFIGPI